MATSQPPFQWTAEQLLEAVKGLSSEELRRFLEGLRRWRREREEEALLREIWENSQLPPEKQKRFNRLRRKLQEETISEAERKELLALWREVERRNVRRLEALIKLARRRGVTVRELMRQLGIKENRDVF
jgi:hypothetical protein